MIFTPNTKQDSVEQHEKYSSGNSFSYIYAVKAPHFARFHLRKSFVDFVFNFRSRRYCSWKRRVMRTPFFEANLFQLLVCVNKARLQAALNLSICYRSTPTLPTIDKIKIWKFWEVSFLTVLWKVPQFLIPIYPLCWHYSKNRQVQKFGIEIPIAGQRYSLMQHWYVFRNCFLQPHEGRRVCQFLVRLISG